MSILPKVLVVDDEPNMEWLFKSSFGGMFDISGARSGEEALERLSRDHFDLVMLDLKLPGMGGMDVLKQIKQLHPIIPVVMMTAYGTVKTAVEAMKTGAHDYVTKPFDVEELKIVMENSLKFGRLTREVEELRDELKEKFHVKNIITVSPLMLNVFRIIEKVASTDAPVAIEGESGTGKELVARAIHWESPRRHRPFLPVNCAALPENLLESELFGYEEGAFTGARRKKPGKFELADGGTVFLDEIGELPMDMQAKVLRVLEEKEIERLGGTRSIPVDIRVICATNKSLRSQVEKGGFREDLYYRLAVIPVSLPPLRERKEDIQPLVAHFVRQFVGKAQQPFSVTPEAMDILRRYDWPGNVRELRNVIQQAVILGDGRTLTPQMLPGYIRGAAGERERDGSPEDGAGRFKLKVGAARTDHEKRLIADALARFNGNRTKVAGYLGISRRSLQMKIKQYKL
ncbi:MAG: sigma-54-dependent transcriptional regulator [Ignavibacteriales bacterium]